jgi:hypothetical protein
MPSIGTVCHAKDAAGKDETSYNRIPKCEIAQQLRE